MDEHIILEDGFELPIAVRVLNPETGEYDGYVSMAHAMTRVAELYPEASQCRKGLNFMEEGKAINARIFMLADTKSGHLPDNAIVICPQEPAF